MNIYYNGISYKNYEEVCTDLQIGVQLAYAGKTDEIRKKWQSIIMEIMAIEKHFGLDIKDDMNRMTDEVLYKKELASTLGILPEQLPNWLWH